MEEVLWELGSHNRTSEALSAQCPSVSSVSGSNCSSIFHPLNHRVQRDLAPVPTPSLRVALAWADDLFFLWSQGYVDKLKRPSDLTNKDTSSHCGKGLGTGMGPKPGQADYFSEIILTRMSGKDPFFFLL